MNGANNPHNAAPHKKTTKPFPESLSKARSSISTKLLLALGFITGSAITAGVVSIIALNNFQEHFDSLAGKDLSAMEDTAHINQLSVAIASRGASLIVSPNTWRRQNLIDQVNDDAAWLKEILDRVSRESLSKNRKRQLLDLKELLLNTYKTLNMLTENRIIFAEHLKNIDDEIIRLQEDLVSIQFSTNLPDGAYASSGPFEQWNASIYAIIFNLEKARNLKHVAPLKPLKEKVLAHLAEMRTQSAYLPIEAKLDANDTFERLKALSTGSGSVFRVKAAELNANAQIEASLRRARTIAERFMSASVLATHDIRSAIDKSNMQTRRSMMLTYKAMVGFILVSLFAAILTFFYANSTVLLRLANLRRSMVAHAEGHNAQIDTSGTDEITDMAHALRYLVDALHLRETGLTAAKEEAEKASSAKTRFLAAASHDLRQPLQALNLFVYTLERREKDEEKRKIIHLLRDSLDSLKELLNALLDISKLEAGVVQAQFKSFHVAPMIARVCGELSPVAEAKGLQLRSVTCHSAVYSDPSLLETIVRNLLDNAIKYTEQGKVLIGCRRHADKLRIEVWDTGPGIPGEEGELIFQEFYQIDNEARKRNQGLGLGLSIVYRLTKLLNCDIEYISHRAKGSVFRVTTPMAHRNIEPPRHNAAQRTHETLCVQDARIAIVEDDEHVSTALQTLLREQGYTTFAIQTISRENIETAFSAMSAAPDLIIADYRLATRFTGSEAIALIRRVSGMQIPAIIMSGDTAPQRLREARQSGYPVLHKPVQAEELLATVRRMLNAHPPTGLKSPPTGLKSPPTGLKSTAYRHAE